MCTEDRREHNGRRTVWGLAAALTGVLMTLAGPLAEGRTARAAGQTAAVTEKGTDYLGRIDCYHDIEYISWRVWTKKKEEEAKKAEEEQRRADEWRLVLVNSEHSLPEDYPVTRAKTEDGQYVDERIAKELAAMLDAAKEDGIDIRVISGYRSYKRQVSLYERKIKRLKRQGCSEEEAVREAGTVVAVPGTSEHMTGLAVDLTSEHNTMLEESQEDTQSYQWLLEHCMEYGFIVRYPEDKKDITGIIYEPWHFRYVGEEHAKIIMEEGLCLEEYLEKYYPERYGE